MAPPAGQGPPGGNGVPPAGVMNNGGSGGVAGLPQSPMFGGPPAMYGSFMDHYMTHGAPGTPDIYGSPAGMPYGRWGGGQQAPGPLGLRGDP